MTLAPRQPTTPARADPGTRRVPDRSRAADYRRSARAELTNHAYRRDLGRFEAWCRAAGYTPLPASPTVLADYLSHLADEGKKVNTIARARAAISAAHELAKVPNPSGDREVKDTWKGIRRRIKTATVKKQPITAKAFLPYFETLREDLRGLRDRALLTLLFAGAFRRSELVGIHREHIRFVDEGMVVWMPSSKTDQEGKGDEVPVVAGGRKALCPVRAMRRWLELAGITTGPVFRAIDRHGRITRRPPGKEALTDQVVADIVKLAAEAADLDPKLFSGHSGRAGFVTAAAKNGADLRSIMTVTRHQQVQTVMGYVRSTQLFEDHAGRGLY
ncbi:MAG: site-specific integrase [Pyrinomonadaceae bacterium]